MKRSKRNTERWLLPMVFVGMLLLISPAIAAPPDHAASVSNEVQKRISNNPHAMIDLIVTYRTPPGLAEKAGVVKNGGKVTHSFTSIPGHAITVPARAVNALMKNPNVSFVTVDAEVSASAVTGAQSGSDLFAADLANVPYTGNGVKVVVIDSGYNTHGDLRTPVDFAHTINLSTSVDGYGHGNHVIGIIAGQGGNKDDDFRGLAPGASIISVKALGDFGLGLTSEVIAAIDYAIDNRVAQNIRVINLSLGHPVYEPAAMDPLVQAVEAAWDAGITVVCSAGNRGADGFGSITSPGNSSRVITVGSVSYFNDGDSYNDMVSS